LPGISRETFDIAPLPFGIERIESERGFTGPAQTRNDNQLLPRNFDMKILQIMLASTTDFDSLRGHRTKYVEPLSQARLLLFSSSIL
jgi:hypothetical protein